MRIYPLIESISLILIGLFSLDAFENVDAHFAERKRGLETDFQLLVSIFLIFKFSKVANRFLVISI